MRFCRKEGIIRAMESVDIHLLQLRYAHTRVMKTSIFRRLRNSIETYGQIVPALVVEDTEKSLSLLMDICVYGRLRLVGRIRF